MTPRKFIPNNYLTSLEKENLDLDPQGRLAYSW